MCIYIAMDVGMSSDSEDEIYTSAQHTNTTSRVILREGEGNGEKGGEGESEGEGEGEGRDNPS